jgi:DNA processing protein
MDRLAEAAALLTLLRAAKSWAGVVRDVEECGSAAVALQQADELTAEQPALFGEPDTQSIDPQASARDEIVRWEREGMHLVTLLEPDYPQQLLTIHQRPPFLMYRGRLDDRDAGGVAIVGTRKASDDGIASAGAIAKGLAQRGVTVVSGLAAGIDTASHRGALDAGGRTVAVIGTGLRKYYPAANRSLQEQIAAEHLVLSQFWPDSPPTKTSFPMRNAVMSGYAAATVVIEAEWRSGARMQARLALEHGRPVFLLETLMRHDWARDYVTRGAIVVNSADDVLARLDEKLQVADELVWS